MTLHGATCFPVRGWRTRPRHRPEGSWLAIEASPSLVVPVGVGAPRGRIDAAHHMSLARPFDDLGREVATGAGHAPGLARGAGRDPSLDRRDADAHQLRELA